MLPPEVAAGVAAFLGAKVSVVGELTSPWSAGTHTVRVAVDGVAGEFVVQWSVGAPGADRRALDRRLRLGRELARRAPWLPVPEVMGGGGGPIPFVLSRYVAGTPGRALLGDDRGAALLGAEVGRLSREIARVPTAGLGLSRTWADPDRLGASAQRWLSSAGHNIPAADAARLRALIERLPEEFGDVRPAFAHGDLAPVNVLFRDGAVVALLDLERARLAHPLFDAAWWRWIVRCHHSERWAAADLAFLSAAGIEPSPRTITQLDALAAFQCLEMLDGTPQGRPETRREWADRVAKALAWREPDRT